MKIIVSSLVLAVLAGGAPPSRADLWAGEAFEPPPALQRFLVERHMPGASRMRPEEFRSGAAKSNAVLRELGADIQWVHSYVAGDTVYCVYQAPSEALIREHARRSGFPADKIAPIAAVLDPTTASTLR